MVPFHPPNAPPMLLPHCTLHPSFNRLHLITSQSHTHTQYTHVTSVFMCVACFDDVLLLSTLPHHLRRLAPPVSCFSLDCQRVSVVSLPGSSSSHSLFSSSTPEFRSPSHGGNLNRSASLSCTERAPECGSVGGSITQIPGTPFQYIPDFCVRALTDLQFVKVTYLVA